MVFFLSKQVTYTFFANWLCVSLQVTGETRWRKHQPLLDFGPRPICSNCSFYENKVEYATCAVEFFCLRCWDAVHFGRNRGNHQFRGLYDFYGKRIDYGASCESTPNFLLDGIKSYLCPKKDSHRKCWSLNSKPED